MILTYSPLQLFLHSLMVIISMVLSPVSNYTIRSLMCQVWNTHNTIQLWDANHTFPLPFFQSHPRHREPESQPKAGVVDFQDSILFGRRGDDSKAGILKMTAFFLYAVMKPFNLIIADNLQGLEEDAHTLLLEGKMTTGAVISDGRIVNDSFSFDTVVITSLLRSPSAI